MESKQVRWIVLIISFLLIVGVLLVIIRDITFFITKREGLAKIVATKKSRSGYKITLSYFNEYKIKSVEAIVKLKHSYKDNVELFGDKVIVYYSKIFPKHVYIKELNVPQKGIIVFQVFFLLLVFLAAKYAFDGIKRT